MSDDHRCAELLALETESCIALAKAILWCGAQHCLVGLLWGSSLSEMAEIKGSFPEVSLIYN